ncbi:MAG: hypothetical protein Terrestrivirus1_352 [Terrestrivirus sp.]|uniref:Uncharacterized protein n=1 Tax=Terrestrivirus sp. TaxID=2487775 RepID=A0A3G4ZKW7_9VIRU|nr:MAG: hypothetical protein Terrestrivirus1_352 [Terrestrivirus sp.]
MSRNVKSVKGQNCAVKTIIKRNQIFDHTWDSSSFCSATATHGSSCGCGKNFPVKYFMREWESVEMRKKYCERIAVGKCSLGHFHFFGPTCQDLDEDEDEFGQTGIKIVKIESLSEELQTAIKIREKYPNDIPFF